MNWETLPGNRIRTYSRSIPYPKSEWNWQKKNAQWNIKVDMYQWIHLSMGNTVSTQTLKIISKGNHQICKNCQVTCYNSSILTAINYGGKKGRKDEVRQQWQGKNLPCSIQAQKWLFRTSSSRLNQNCWQQLAKKKYW